MGYTYGSESNCTLHNGPTNSKYKCRLGYQVNSQSIENNTSNVTLRLQVKSTDSGYATYGYKQTTKIDGTSLSAKSFDMRDTNTWKTFGERTITISHNSDGTCSKSKSGSFSTTATSTYSLKSGSASVTVEPSTIARASDFSLNFSRVLVASVPETASILTISIDRKSSSFTHLVEIYLGGIRIFYNDNVGTSVNYNTYNIWQSFPNTKGELNGEVRVTTKNGSTTIGSTKTKLLTAYLEESFCTPRISSFSITSDNTTMAKAGSGTIIKNFTTVYYSGEAHTYKYSNLNNILVNGGQDVQEKAGIDSNTQSGETRTINFSGTLKSVQSKDFIATIADTRNLTNWSTVSFPTLKEYFKPKISTAKLVRLNKHLSSGGVPDDTGTATKLVLEGTFWNDDFGLVQNDLKSITCQFKDADSSSYSELKKGNGSSITVSDITKSGNIFSLEIDVIGDILQDDLVNEIYYGFTLDNAFNLKVSIEDELLSDEFDNFVLEEGRPYIEVTEGEDGKGLIDFKCPIKFNKLIGPQKILWQGGTFMHEQQSAILSENISEQNNGIILVFSGYDTSVWEVKDYNWSSHFISKKEIELVPSSGHIFFMGGTEGLSGFKYLNISDDVINGHDINDNVFSNDYGKYDNNRFVLRYIIGI